MEMEGRAQSFSILLKSPQIFFYIWIPKHTKHPFWPLSRTPELPFPDPEAIVLPDSTVLQSFKREPTKSVS